jgi:hypothetical protein
VTRRPPLPAPPEALGERDGARLLDLLEEARREQRREAVRAFDEALAHVPRLLRPAIRRVLGG